MPPPSPAPSDRRVEKGQAYAWGANDYGQLGHGDAVNRRTPTLIDAMQSFGVFAAFAGQRNSFLVSDSGDVFAVGSNDYGQLGTGDLIERRTPTFMTLLRGLNVHSQARFIWLAAK